MLTIIFEKWLKLALVLAISVEHFILENLLANAKKTLCCAHFWSIVLTAVPYGHPCGRAGSPRTQLSYSDVSLLEALTCLWVSSRRVNWAERNSENGEFWKLSSKAPWAIPFREFVTVKMAESAQPSYSEPILIRAPYFHLIIKCWPMNSTWTFMIFVFYRMHNDSMKMLQLNLTSSLISCWNIKVYLFWKVWPISEDPHVIHTAKHNQWTE